MAKFLHDTVHRTKDGEVLTFAAGDEVPAFLDLGSRHTLQHLLSPEDLEAYLAPPPAPKPKPAPKRAEDPKDDR